MPSAAVTPTASRRDLRRQDSVEEVLATALQVMAESGAGGLSLGEVARRMGMQPPSLYQYFASKNAIYDALFARGWRAVAELIAPYETALPSADNPRETFAAATVAFVRWAMDHPAYAQLMFWRPVPGFTPSEEAYGPAVDAMSTLGSGLRILVDRGVLALAAASDDGLRVYTTLFSGVISQQLANEPTASYDDGVFCALVPTLLAMFFDQYRRQP